MIASMAAANSVVRPERSDEFDELVERQNHCASWAGSCFYDAVTRDRPAVDESIVMWLRASSVIQTSTLRQSPELRPAKDGLSPCQKFATQPSGGPALLQSLLKGILDRLGHVLA
ncbi:MAG: hypothetical protein E5W25_27735, partial [Mesorhizobium sp.]